MSKDGSSGESGCQESSSADGSPGDAAAKDLNASIYESKEPKKIVRIITVLAYMFSVSFVAIVLSAYYLFLWEPPNPRLMHGTAIRLRADPQLNFLRVELPPSKYTKETIPRNYTSRDNDSIVGNNDWEDTGLQERTIDYEGFEESLTSLKTTLAELIRERNNGNDSSSAIVGQYIVTRGNKERYEKRIDEKINSRNFSGKNLRGSSYDNSTRVMRFDRRERMDDESEDTSLTDEIIYNVTTDDDLRQRQRRRRNETGNNEEKTQVKKVTAKSTTMNDIIADDSSMMSTTTGPREKSLLQILIKSVKPKELSSTVASTELHRTVDVVTITEPYEENKNRN